MEVINIENETLSHGDKVKLILDFFHRQAMHHVFWFNEVSSRLGTEKALKILDTAWDKSYTVQINRLAKVLGFGITGGLPDPFLNLPAEKLDELIEACALNWLATDGIWFQSVEFGEGMAEAKQCNDNCWSNFSPIEAWSVKKLLNLPDNPGLDGLKSALKYRLYAFINEQSVVEETSKSFVFRMNKCRVQEARKRKGLEDYPCKSAGMVEYSTFASSIDNRIKTECVCCPPDMHTEDFFCAWRFSI
jgi:hypothetical protein